MARYVVSDHHFGHANIIDYCDRPFASPGEMDDALLGRHHEVVGPDDALVHLGDVAMDMRDGRETVARFERLGGGLLVRGNHDVGLDPVDAPFPVVDACVVEAGDYRFYCTHRPADAPEWWDGWVLHGHHHDNDTGQFPFVAYDDRRVNAAVELLDYRPVALSSLVELLDACVPGDRLRDVTAARERLPGFTHAAD
jgi:calcineurin-like phosphoesterase family protein